MTTNPPMQPIDVGTLIQQGKLEAPPEQLDQAGKEALAEAGTPITVNAIQYGESGEFGPYWEFHALVNGKATTFRLSSHESRDTWIQALAAVTGQGQPISGLRLRAIATRGGNKFITVEQA